MKDENDLLNNELRHLKKYVNRKDYEYERRNVIFAGLP